MILFRAMWAAASAPVRFFEQLEALDEQFWQSFAVMLLSWLSFAILQSIHLIRLSQSSSAFLPIVTFSMVVGVISGAVLWLLGGTVLQRPSQLVMRAYELTAWAWAPAFFVALSFLPASLFAPRLSLILSTLILAVWHVRSMWLGLKGFGVTKKANSFALYLVAIVLIPALLFITSMLMVAGLRR